MLFLLLTWSVTFVILLMAGVGASRIWLKSYSLSIDQYFFLGFGIVSILTSYFSIIGSIGQAYTFALFSIILIFFPYRWSHLNYLKSKWNNAQREEWILGLITILFIALIAARKITEYDTGLYHAQSILWLKQFPVVPGLGNLHGRLAFNPMFFPISALFTIDLNSWGGILIYP